MESLPEESSEVGNEKADRAGWRTVVRLRGLWGWVRFEVPRVFTLILWIIGRAEFVPLGIIWWWYFQIADKLPKALTDEQSWIPSSFSDLFVPRNGPHLGEYGFNDYRVPLFQALIGLSALAILDIVWRIWWSREKREPSRGWAAWTRRTAACLLGFLAKLCFIFLVFIPVGVTFIVPRIDLPRGDVSAISWRGFEIARTGFVIIRVAARGFLGECESEYFDRLGALALASESRSVRANALNQTGGGHFRGPLTNEALTVVAETRGYDEAKEALFHRDYSGDWPRVRRILARFGDEPELVVRGAGSSCLDGRAGYTPEATAMVERAVFQLAPRADEPATVWLFSLSRLLKARPEKLPYDYLAELGLVPKDPKDLPNWHPLPNRIWRELELCLNNARYEIDGIRYTGRKPPVAAQARFPLYWRALDDPRNLDILFELDTRVDGEWRGGRRPEYWCPIGGRNSGDSGWDAAWDAYLLRLTDWLIQLPEELKSERHFRMFQSILGRPTNSYLFASDANAKICMRRVVDSGSWDMTPLPKGNYTTIPKGRTFVDAPRTYGDYVRAQLEGDFRTREDEPEPGNPFGSR